MKKYFPVIFVLAVVAAVSIAVDLNDTGVLKSFVNGYLTKREDGFISNQAQAYQIDQPNATTTYIRYINTVQTQLIKKVSSAGSLTTFETAYDTWSNRTTATYSPINGTIE